MAPTSKHTYVHFKQRHQGLEVLFSRMMVKFNSDDRVIGFGADVYDGISVETMPYLSDADAKVIAGSGLTGVTGSAAESELRILPVPAHRSIEFHLVYEVMVSTMNGNMPGRTAAWSTPTTARCFTARTSGELRSATRRC
jgi:hypothetical protein